MNHVIIYKLTDLTCVIESPIVLSGNLDTEIYNNMFALTFCDDLIRKINVQTLEEFLSQLLRKRTSQLYRINPTLTAKFYCWFDEQALQLRFNIISDYASSLPFGCKMHILDTPKPIFTTFLEIAYHVSIQGQDLQFIDSHEDQDNEDDEEKYTLDIYLKILGASRYCSNK